MTPIRTRATALGASTLIAVVALTGCANDPAPTEAPTAAPTVEAVAPEPEVEPTPTVEPAPAPEPAPVYELDDGTEVEIDPGATKLPKAVRQDLARKATATADAAPHEFASFMRDAERRTGKRVIVIQRTAIEPEGRPHGMYWTVAAHPSAIHAPVDTKAEAVSIAEAHVASQPDPAGWAIVVSTQ